MALASDRETVLQLPKQSFYPAGTQIGGGEIDWSLVLQLGMWGSEKALGFLRRLPDLFGQSGQPGNALEPFALGRPQPPFFFPPLQRGPWHHNLLNPGLLALGKVPDHILQGGKGETASHGPLEIGDRGHILPENLGPSEVLRDLQDVWIAGHSTLLLTN